MKTVPLLSLAALCLASPPALGSWKLSLEGVDISAAASLAERGGILLANITTLAPGLGVQVQLVDDQLLLLDAGGTEWRARNGALQLDALGQTRPLSAPVLLQGASAYLPLEVIAGLAGLQLSLDRPSQQAMLTRQHREVAATADGWQPLTIEKTPEEKAEQSLTDLPPENSRRATALAHLPPEHDSLSLGFGVGYVQGADWGMELSGSGQVLGTEVSFGSLLSQGPRGVLGQGSHLAVTDNERGWSAQMGDLFSDVWGLARGARYAWRAGNNHWPSLSFYLRVPRLQVPRPVLAYRDEIQFHPGLWLGGEFATDGSTLLRARYEKSRVGLYAYGRSTTAKLGRGAGAFFSYNIGKGLSLYGGVSESSPETRKEGWRNLALRIPLRSGVDLTLDHTRISSGLTTNRINAVTLALPIGPVRFLTRYQVGRTGLFQVGPTVGATEMEHREVNASIMYPVSTRMRLDYQVSTRWEQTGRRSGWEQLISTFQLSNRTQLSLISAFPDLFAPDQFRLRVSHALRNGVSLTMDYGQLTPFQGIGARPGERGLMLMLRSQCGISTPARGGRITGRVVDQLGHPLRDAVVRLAGYQAATDQKGRYQFRHVPPGSYEISLDETSLPADYATDHGKQQLLIHSRSRMEVNFRVIPLHTISGRVYWDKDGNGEFDAGEGIAGVVLHLGEFATATGEDGSFAFYNAEPGQHSISLDIGRLPVDYIPASPGEISVDLPPDRSVSDLTFRLVKREKEVIFQPVP